MAELYSQQSNPFYIDTEEGIYRDIEVNLLSILKRSFDDPTISRSVKPIDWNTINPKFKTISDLPGLYVYCDGEEPRSQQAGGLGGRKQSFMETYYVSIQYIHSELRNEVADGHVKTVAAFLKEEILKNLNLNDIMNGPSELLDIDFAPQLQRVNEQLVMVHSVKIRVKYKRTSTTRVSTR